MKHEEHDLQVAFVRWFRLQYPSKRKLLFAIPNGAKLSGSPLQRAKAWKRLEAEGAQAGVADMLLSIPRGGLHGLYIETKTPTGRQSADQKEFEAAVVSEGYGYAMPRSLEEAIRVVKMYLETGKYTETMIFECLQISGKKWNPSALNDLIKCALELPDEEISIALFFRLNGKLEGIEYTFMKSFLSTASPDEILRKFQTALLKDSLYISAG